MDTYKDMDKDTGKPVVSIMGLAQEAAAGSYSLLRNNRRGDSLLHGNPRPRDAWDNAHVGS
jgi:hypothetical protein